MAFKFRPLSNSEAIKVKQMSKMLDIGHPKHFSQVVCNPYQNFRFRAALEGNDTHRQQLVNDPDWLVRTVARKRLANPNYDENSEELDRDLEKYYDNKNFTDMSDH